MSRCIDADALEELFREVIGGIAKKPEMSGNLEHMVRASAMVIEMIKDAPTIKPEPHWIPCSERLPEERQEILATTTDNAWGDVVIIRTYYKEMHKSVIAWMPLPEPYREDGDGK